MAINTLGSLGNIMQQRRQNMMARGTANRAQNQATWGAINANPQAFASWFGQQNPQTQQGLVSPGGGGVQTPWGTLGNEGRTINALQQGGINANALNQFINNTDASRGQAGAQNTNLWDFIPGGSKYGPSSYDATGWDKVQPGITQSTQYNPNAYTGQAIPQSGGAPGQPNVPTPTTPAAPQTLGGMASGQAPATTAQPNNASVTNPAAPNYPLNIGAYLNPQADYMQQQAMKNLQGTYAGAGDLLSGPAMKAIVDYSQNMAQGNAWNPAVATAQQQQGFGYGVNANDRAFAAQQALLDQTIPFNQQMQLAQLGLQGTQGQQSVANLLATLLSGNTIAAGQAAGTGTIGGSNAINNAISQMLSNYLGQNLLNRIPGLNQPPATGATPTGGR